MIQKNTIILASASPRRADLLKQAGIDFIIKPAKGEEITTKTLPSEIVEELSYQKAKEIAAQTDDGIILGADTVVSLKDEILQKPVNDSDAFRMLSGLQGRTHTVYTGVTLIKTVHGSIVREFTFHEFAKVEMYSFTEEELWEYVRTKEPRDKAGAYAIQGYGTILVKRIEGDYNTIVGLPVSALCNELKRSNWL